jgi:hypothetical protein
MEAGMAIELILLIAAFILFALAAIGVSSRFNLGWAGMACVALAMLSPSIG